jgi:GGDEF domain-containing protein
MLTLSDEEIEFYEDLEKMDSSLAEALRAFRAAGLHEHANTVARHLFADTMIPRLGNKMAYQDHLSRHRQEGYHVHIDGNNMSSVNKLHGEQAGDDMIRKLGNHVADVSRQFGGKSHRNGGDEFKAFFNTPEQAHGFARELRTRLDKEPILNGTHKLSSAIGIGYNPEHAELALQHAKKQLGPTDPNTGKRANIHQLHETPTVMHSLTHEAPPPGWTPGKGKPEVAQPTSHVPHGLTLHNPLKTP